MELDATQKKMKKHCFGVELSVATMIPRAQMPAIKKRIKKAEGTNPEVLSIDTAIFFINCFITKQSC